MTCGQIIWKALLDAYDSALELIVVNVLWVLFTLPVVTAPGAAVGLNYYAHRMVYGERVTWRTFFEGFRQYWWPGFRWAALNAVVIVAIIGSYVFYGRMQQAWADFLQASLPMLLVTWLLLQVFVLPLLFELERPRVREALRLSALIYLRTPGCSLLLAVLLAVLTLLSTVLALPWVLFTASLCAVLANRIAAEGLAKLTGRLPPP